MNRTGRASVWDSRALRVSAVLTLVATAVAVVNGATGRPWPETVEWCLLPLITIPAVYLVRKAATDPRAKPEARRVWRIYTVGLSVIVAALTASLLGTFGDQWAWATRSAGILQVVGGLVMAWAVFRIPLNLRTTGERLALALDLCTLLAASAVVLWVVLGFIKEHTAGAAIVIAPALPAQMGGALVGILLAAKAMMAGTETLPRRTLMLTAFCSFVGGMGNAVGALMAADHRFNFLVLVDAWASLAAGLSARYPVVEHLRGVPPVRRAGRFSKLPYLAAAAVAGLLVLATSQKSADLPGVVAATVVIIALVILRQLVAFRENSGLLTKLELEEERFRLLVQNSTDIVVITDLDGAVEYISPAVLRVLGHTPAALRGTGVGALIHDEDRPVIRAALADIAETAGASATYQIRLRHADGTWRWLELITSNLMHERSIGARVSNARDITETRQVQDRLSHDASHDALTGLANRVLFHERVTAALAVPGRRISVVLVDLDDFKTVNDTLGHGVGDGLLGTVADRMTAGVRPTDLVARLGGDEFAILFDGLEPADVERVLTRIAKSLLEPADVDGHRLSIKASFGVVGGRAGDDAADLLRRADIAMYEAKALGQGSYQRYVPGMEARGAERGRLTAELLTAIEHRQLVLHYQPVVTLPEGHLIGVEALVRWQHPERGLLPPGEFIPAAEESGLIVALGRWVLREATRQAAAWLADYGDHGPATVSVNASARQIQPPGFAADVARALRDSGLPPGRLTVEITESTAVGGGATAQTLRDLHDLGVRLSLDDFGTGASTLGLLANCPVDEIKLDRSFTPGPDTIAGAVLQLAKALGVDAVAEGVETGEQAEKLRRLGYDHAQGYHFARPMTADQITAHYEAELDGSRTG